MNTNNPTVDPMNNGGQNSELPPVGTIFTSPVEVVNANVVAVDNSGQYFLGWIYLRMKISLIRAFLSLISASVHQKF